MITVNEEELPRTISKSSICRERQNEIHAEIKSKSLQRMFGMAAAKEIDSVFKQTNKLGKLPYDSQNRKHLGHD